jgi:hypothetical protein
MFVSDSIHGRYSRHSVYLNTTDHNTSQVHSIPQNNLHKFERKLHLLSLCTYRPQYGNSRVHAALCWQGPHEMCGGSPRLWRRNCNIMQRQRNECESCSLTRIQAELRIARPVIAFLPGITEGPASPASALQEMTP